MATGLSMRSIIMIGSLRFIPMDKNEKKNKQKQRLPQSKLCGKTHFDFVGNCIYYYTYQNNSMYICKLIKLHPFRWDSDARCHLIYHSLLLLSSTSHSFMTVCNEQRCSGMCAICILFHFNGSFYDYHYYEYTLLLLLSTGEREKNTAIEDDIFENNCFFSFIHFQHFSIHIWSKLQKKRCKNSAASTTLSNERKIKFFSVSFDVQKLKIAIQQNDIRNAIVLLFCYCCVMLKRFSHVVARSFFFFLLLLVLL